jgi:FKBP-type peptidyl-prolyl cis-trans isomerase FkpA
MIKLQALILIAVFSLAACKQPAKTDSADTEAAVMTETLNCPKADASGNIQIAPGLSARIIDHGWGRAAVKGDYADTNVWLWLYDENAEDRHGMSIWESGDDILQFQLGAGQVIKGWDMGVPCMLEGETRELTVASDLAYGPAGSARDGIPPNATLIFTIELLKLTTPQ